MGKQYPNASISSYGTISGAKAMQMEIAARGPISCGIDAQPILEYTSGIATDREKWSTTLCLLLAGVLIRMLATTGLSVTLGVNTGVKWDTSVLLSVLSALKSSALGLNLRHSPMSTTKSTATKMAPTASKCRCSHIHFARF